jgi:signal transduction histidine kinase
MNERVALLGGRMTIDSTPEGAGTMVSAELPLS